MSVIDHIPILSESRQALIELCRRYRVAKLFVFGSVVTEDFDSDRSDIDLIVELSPMSPEEKGEHLLNLWDDLEELFQKKVDLLTDQPINNPYLKENLDRTKRLIYDGGRQEVLV